MKILSINSLTIAASNFFSLGHFLTMLTNIRRPLLLSFLYFFAIDQMRLINFLVFSHTHQKFHKLVITYFSRNIILHITVKDNIIQFSDTFFRCNSMSGILATFFFFSRYKFKRIKKNFVANFWETL